jgi:hypothetical protein
MLVVLVSLVLTIVSARFHDGPLGIIAGGPLRSGELLPSKGVDWSFADPVREIELQLVDPPRSRTVWVVVREGQLYVACGFLKVPLWKQWPHQALKDGRAVARILGKRYEFQAVRVEDPNVHASVTTLVAQKYGLRREGPAGPDNTWVFRLDPPS